MENTTLALNVSSAITTAASNNTNTVNEPVNNATTAAPNATTSALSTPPSLTTTTPRCPNDTSSNTTPANFLGKRPMFAVNLRADPEIFELLQTIKSLKPVQSSFGVHKVAIHGRIGTIADVENALLYAWTPSGKTPEQSGLTIKIISINDYGTFSEKGEPVVDIAYVVGMKPVPITARNKFTSSSIVIRVPTTQIIGSRLAERNISMCSCNVYRGELLHIKEIFDLSANVSSYVDALRNAWESHKPVSACGESVVKAFGGIPVTTIQPEGARMRFTTIPYFVTSNDKPWNHPESRPDQSELSKQLHEKGLNSDLYDGTAPISKDLSFVDYLNGSISFQEIPKVNTELADYISNATDQSPLKPILWNLEPFINSNGSIVTQEGFFIVLPNNRTLDPRLFYADAIKDTMKNRSSETLVPNPIIPLYLKGQLQEEQWPTIINSLSSVQPNSNFTVVGMEYGLQAFDNSTRDVTEVLVSTALPNGDSEVLPEIFSTLAKTLYSDLTADALDTALSNLNMSVCRNCQYSKLRMLNLLRTGTDVDPKQNLGTDVILNRISSSWNESNAVTNEGIPLNVQLIGRDDMLANENGTLVSQFSYSVAYPSPARHWYIVREPTPELFNKAFADLHVEPFAGALVHL
ncbi:uncharacterized protein LOC129584251 isoform X2 [Paramacrobiotus metropolitanus]|uniref:uncharacterized protein LOC129584251 isoform X2 n=1 Tax=Paramacrobiotus metropolitanus TaxID=2943436 RepID=UPI002445D849|nr:uncharacterized protein LOC129584251 isoform X2 [Paramacrobiotus metropolitanus]